jgi:hypothetical protein
MRYEAAQPGGIVEARIVKKDGAIRDISIRGAVGLGATMPAL